MSRGFTLVELAIVLTIIGLLIGGILKGQQLIANTRMTTTIAQVQAYRAANTTFRDMYQTLPGDLPTATTRITGCTAATNCYNGDGNGFLGVVSTNYSHDDQSNTIAQPRVETTMYWQHLAGANLISGVRSGANPVAPEWGSTHPAAKIGGGFHVLSANEPAIPAGNNPAAGAYFILRSRATGDPHPTTPGIEVLTPTQAERIDLKMDDGNAREGGLRCDDASGTCSTNATGIYQSGSRKDCLMIFSIE